MEISHIKCFMAVAEEKSFTKAAEKMYKSQSVLSRQIQSLEKELEFPLFLRDTQSCELTSAGRYLYDSLKKLNSEFSMVLDNAKMKSKGLSGSISVGMSSGENNYHLSDLTCAISEKLPDISFSYHGLEVKDIRSSLLNNTCDIVFTISTQPWFNNIKDPSFRFIHVGTRHDCLYMSKQHPLASRDVGSLTLQDFADETFLVLSPYEINGKTGPTVNLLKSYGIDPKYQEIESLDSLIISLRNNQGVHIGSNRIWCFENSNFVTVSIPDLGSHSEIMIWSENNPNPCLNTYISKVRTFLAQNPKFATDDILSSTSF